MAVQKRVNIAYLTAIFEKSDYKVGPWLASKNLDFRTVSTTDECINCANNMVHAEHLLSCSESGMWYVPGRGCLCDQCWALSL